MGLSWQQGPLSPGAIGRFLVPEPLPKGLLYAEPLRRRMRVLFAGTWIADSENVLLLFEPGRYPVACFPETDVSPDTLERAGYTTRRHDLGLTSWYTVRHAGRSAPRAAWQHIDLPACASDLRGRVAFAWPGASDKRGEDFDAAGRLSRSVFAEAGLPRDAEIYLCGPVRFMADMREALAGMGVPPGRIHAEIFNGGEPVTPGVVGAAAPTPHAPADDANTGPLVSFARSGIAAHWKPSACQSILELAETRGLPVRWSCRTGVCHTCESGLVSGTVVYQPEPLDSPAAGNLR